MRARLPVRDMTTEEQEAIEQLARSRTGAARLVERARIIWQARRGRAVAEIAERLKISQITVGRWLKRFNTFGVVGLSDRPRSGRSRTYTAEQRAEGVATALTKPQTLKLPFASWTLDRLEMYPNEQRRIAIKRSRIDEILLAEGLRWRSQETWFSERVDPEFAEKRGRLKALRHAAG
ncbi:MAG: helix-turn-helix domain-containing protein [Anaerolineales bacterium]